MRSASNKHVRGERRKKKHSDHQGAPVPYTMCSNHRRGGEGESKCITTADRARKRPTQKKKKSCQWYHFNHIKIDLHARNRGGRDGSCHLVEWVMGSNERSGVSKGTPPVFIFNQDIAICSKYLCHEIRNVKNYRKSVYLSRAGLTDGCPLLAMITDTVQ